MKYIDTHRSSLQNNSLHLMFKQISDECMAKGIDMRELVRDEIPIQCTPENIKWMWKLLQKALFGTASTTQLKKTGQIAVVWDNFNKILINRTDGEIVLPPFPHDPAKQKEHTELPRVDYPTEVVEEPLL